MRHLGLDDVLTYICDHAADRESRDMAEQGEHSNYVENLITAPSTSIVIFSLFY